MPYQLINPTIPLNHTSLWLSTTTSFIVYTLSLYTYTSKNGYVVDVPQLARMKYCMQKARSTCFVKCIPMTLKSHNRFPHTSLHAVWLMLRETPYNLCPYWQELTNSYNTHVVLVRVFFTDFQSLVKFCLLNRA